MLDRVPVREQDPKLRATNFGEVAYGYLHDEAVAEANRCLNCRKKFCKEACPVAIDIPAFIAHIKEGDIAAAADVIRKDSMLPSICGRVCPQEIQCEGECVLGKKGKAVAIGALERFVGDWELKNPIQDVAVPAVKEAKVAIVGSGPAGLTCAADLAQMGYEVVVFEALHKLGGVLQYGIPEFRLPKSEVVEREIAKVERLGVKFELNTIIGRTLTIDELFDNEGFSAVFVASGAGLPKFMGIGGENLNGVISANEFLTRTNLMKAYRDDYDTPIIAGKRTVVVGGGNVAMDAVRTALRLGAEATIVYRRSEEELPARLEEVHHARQEGIDFRMLTNPVEILGDGEGRVRGIRCIRMELGKKDESGRRKPVEVAGSEFEIECDVVIMALGTSPNPLIVSTTEGIATTRWGGIVADDDTATSREGIFAGGDAVTGAATVILAMGAGRKAAVAINEYLCK